VAIGQARAFVPETASPEKQWEGSLDDAAVAWRKLLRDWPSLYNIVEVLHQTRRANPSAGDFCLLFLQAVIVVIGRSTELNNWQRETIRALCREVEWRPFPALPWARFISAQLGNLACLKDKIGHLSEDKRYLLEQIEERVAEEGARIGLGRRTRVLIHGYSGVIPNVLNKLPLETKQTLQLFITEQHRRQDSEGQQFFDHLRTLDETNPWQHVEVVPDQRGLLKLQNGEVDTFVMSAKAVGLIDAKLGVINTFSAQGLPAAAHSAGIPTLVISGRYKMWPQDLFAEHAERVRNSTEYYDALIPEEHITWFATEGGAFTPQECRTAYEPWLSATMETYPGWALQRVPSFFQKDSEEARRAKFKWCKDSLRLSSHYFARLLGMERHLLDQWSQGNDVLGTIQYTDLDAFWRLYLRLSTLYDNDSEAVRRLFEYEQRGQGQTDVPWNGTSIKAYLEDGGPTVIPIVQLWFDSLRVPKAVPIP